MAPDSTFYIISRASIEDQQQIISELEQERFIANKRAHRLEEEMKTQELVST
jgi:hypothetical protein